MIEVQEALDLIDRFTSRSKSVKRPVNASLNGLVLAEEVFSTVNLPEFRQSSMDGYAINGVSDNYQVIGEVPAGSSDTFEIKPGEAVRIFTGARVPDSADRVRASSAPLRRECRIEQVPVRSAYSHGRSSA